MPEGGVELLEQRAQLAEPARSKTLRPGGFGIADGGDGEAHELAPAGRRPDQPGAAIVGVRNAFDVAVALEVRDELGAGTALHPFEVAHLDVPQHPLPMFERGWIDHFGLTAADAESFAELRRRVMAEGAGDGLVTDMGAFLSFSFRDPDGLGLEVMYVRPEHVSTEIRHRAAWTYSDAL